MSVPYSFQIRVSISNDEGHEDIIFEDEVTVASEHDLLETKVASEWMKASRMADERADDGTDWDVAIECLSVREPMSGQTDWEDDLMPQRDDISSFLQEEMSSRAPDQ